MDRTGHSLSQLFVVAASMMALAGSLGVETGVVLLSIGIDLGIGYDIVGTLVSFRFVGGMIGSLALLVWPPRHHVMPAYLVAACLVLFSTIPLMLARGLPVLLVVGLMRGAAIGIIIPTSNYTVRTWFRHRAGRYSGLFNAAFGVGMVAMPLAARPFVQDPSLWRWAWSLSTLIAACAICYALVLVLRHRDRAPTGRTSGANRVVSKPRMPDYILVQMLVVCVVAAEATAVGWMPSLVEIGTGLDASSLALAISLAILGGRLVCGYASDRVGVARYHRASGVLLVAAFAVPPGALAWLGGYAHATWIGLAMSAIYPTMIAMVVQRFSETERRTYMGIGISGGIGGALAGALVGVLAEHRSVYAAALVGPPTMVAALLIGAILCRRLDPHATETR